MTGDRIRAGVLVAVVVAAATLAGVGTAATGGSIDASPSDAGATSTHEVTATVDSDEGGSSLNGLAVHYEETDVSNVGQSDLVDIRIEHADGESVDVSDDVSSVGAENNGETLNVGLGGSYDLSEGDQIVVAYDGAQNPDAGDYGVGIRINPQSSSAEASATLSITNDSPQTTSEPTTTETTTSEPTTSEPTTSEPTTTETTTSEPTTTDSGGSDPGGSDPVTTTTTDSGSDETDEPMDTERANVTADPADANAAATHTVSALVDNETASDSWNGLEVDYNGTGVDVSNVGQGDVTRIGIDRTGNTSNDTLTVNVSDDLSSVDASNDGETLTVGLGGNYTLEAGDEVVVAYEDVQNPGSGDYSVPVDVNHQSSGGAANASLSVDATETATTQTSEATPTDDPTETATATPTDSPGTTEDSSPASSPGFGALAAIVALAAAALLARR